MTARPPGSTLDAERRAALLGAKLAAVAATLPEAHRPPPTGVTPRPFPGGAALVAGHDAWILAEDRPERSLGAAVAWAEANGIDHLDLLAADHAGVLARRAGQLTDAPHVWALAGTEAVPAVPADPLPVLPLDPRAERFRPLLTAAGAEPLVERGVLVGEVDGLEVARVVTDEDGVRLEVGVGRHDRDAFRQLHGELPPAEALEGVVRTVRRHRLVSDRGHPLHRLATERSLRRRVIAHPALVGASRLDPADPPVPRANLKEPAPAVATGVDRTGGPVVVVCSVGVDPDLVPFAADARLVHERGARLVLALPPRDLHPVTKRLAARLVEPAELVAVDRG